MSFAKPQRRAVEWAAHPVRSRNPPIERTGTPHKGARRRPETLERLVLDLLRRAGEPLTAHQLIACGKDDDFNLTPIQVYRVLGRLVARNAVQRIELLSAYLPIEGVPGGFVVCRCCFAVSSVPISTLAEAIAGLCQELQFSNERTVVEVMGLCSTCQKEGAAYPKPAPARLTRARRTSNALKETVIKLKSFAGMAMLGAAALLSPPADAEERKAGTLYGANGKPIGKITVTAPKGVLLRVEASGLPPGWHGMHFHETANCDDAAFKGAGAHVHSVTRSFTTFSSRMRTTPAICPISVDEKDGASVELYSTLVSVRDGTGGLSLTDADGSALIIHANADDYDT